MVQQSFIDYVANPLRECTGSRTTECAPAPNPGVVIRANETSRKLAFSAMGEVKASRFATGLRKLADMGPHGVVLSGAWCNRRFVIVGGRPSYEPVAGPSFDFAALTLTLPVPCDADAIVRECRRFGGQVERAFRDRHRGEFEVVSSSSGGPRHIVHRYHHVALCGSKGPWLGDSSHVFLDGGVVDCDACRTISCTKPVYAARFHPLTSAAGTVASDFAREKCDRDDLALERAGRARLAVEIAIKRG